MNILVTGGTGFVGQAVRRALRESSHAARWAVRKPESEPAGNLGPVSVVGPIGPRTDWSGALEGIDAVVHLAARAHQIRDVADDPRAAFLEVNYGGTKQLAEQAAGRVRRFIFLSSIGVHGVSSGSEAFNESSPIVPTTPYAESKARAEECVLNVAANGGFEAVVLRPPLVYGPEAPGNLARLINIVRRGVPLPLGRVRNRRSLIGVDHLAAAIRVAVEAENVDSRSYVVADREVVSTPEIIRSIATGLGRSVRLFPVPAGVLSAVGAATGRSATIEQLVGNLMIDADDFRRDFGPIQPCSTGDGLIEAVRGLPVSNSIG